MFERMLLAIDETPAGEVAVSFATALAHENGASVHVVHANIVLLGGRGVTVETNEQSLGVLAGALAQLRAGGVDASGEQFRATIFDVATRIARSAERFGADAVVRGSHRRRRLARLAGAGIRERVARATALPVITAPPPLKVGGRRGSAAAIRRLARDGAPAGSTR